MSIQKFLASSLAEAIAGGTEFAAMKSLVADMEAQDLAPEVKRAKVIEDFKAIGYELAGWTVNALLELALIWLRAAV